MAWSKTADKIEGFREYLTTLPGTAGPAAVIGSVLSTEKEKLRHFVWISDGVWGRWGTSARKALVRRRGSS